jgi:hypothetical protein
MGRGTVEGRLLAQGRGQARQAFELRLARNAGAKVSAHRRGLGRSQGAVGKKAKAVLETEMQEGHARASVMASFIRARARLSELFTVPSRTPRVEAISSRDKSAK